MTTYVLTYHDCTGVMKCADGVWGVFDSFDKAMTAVEKCIDVYDESTITIDNYGAYTKIFTHKSVYKIEAIQMNDFPV